MPERTTFRTGDQALVREINLSLVMNHLREHAPVSRAALAEMTGLNKSTISSLVHELIEHHFVREVGLSSASIGRPSTLLELNPAAGDIVSGEIGVDYISVITTDFAAKVIWRRREYLSQDIDQDGILEQAFSLFQEAVDAGRTRSGELLGLALGVPGLVDQVSGTLLFAPNLRWENVPLRKLLRDQFPGLPVFVDNEANMAALGEHYFGAAQGFGEVLYISVGVGLGGAIVAGSQLFRGKTGFACEFGHMTMNPEGLLCNCGNRGCWETLVSQSAIFRHVRQAVDAGATTMLCEMAGDDLNNLTIPIVVEAARAGDRVAVNALQEVGHQLGIGIASLVNALNPDLVLFGGILSLAGDFLLPIVREELRSRALRWNANATQVVIAQHGADACVMGGVAVVFQTILAQPAVKVRR